MSKHCVEFFCKIAYNNKLGITVISLPVYCERYFSNVVLGTGKVSFLHSQLRILDFDIEISPMYK